MLQGDLYLKNTKNLLADIYFYFSSNNKELSEINIPLVPTTNQLCDLGVSDLINLYEGGLNWVICKVPLSSKILY